MSRVRVWLSAVLSALILSSLILLSAEAVQAQDVERAPIPAWVRPMASDTAASPVDAAPVRVLAKDQQIRFTSEGVEFYSFQRTRVQTSQGLGMVSTVSGSWSPERETIQVHTVRILRGDQVIDVLDSQQFQTLRRENNLESNMLDGVLTATLQPRDLRVGDILESAFTIRDSGGVLAPHRESLESLNSGLVIDHYRLRAVWPSAMPIQVQGVGSWADVAPRRTRDGWELEIDRRNLQPRRLPDDLPTRFYLDRIVQFTDFSTWAQASALMAPLYKRAETLEADSPLIAEIERIRTAHSTPEAQAAAALRLVQDQIRYISLSMGEGNYAPASADEVWRSRFGDCKGKTALLMALLNGLGIEAEPVLVSTRLGDGLDQRLPLFSWFDHVLVRAVVDGREYWLDGTRIGDRDLASIIPPYYHWGLPVRDADATLIPIDVPPASRPDTEISVTADLSDGLDAPARLEMDMAMTGDTATAYRQRISSIPADQLEAMLKAPFQDDDQTFQVESVSHRWDDDSNTFHLIMTGTTRLAWVAGSAGRLLAIDGTALISPTQDERKGLHVAYKDDPYSNTYPTQARSRTRMILPGGGEGFRIEGEDQVVETAGYRLERSSTLRDGIAEFVVTSTSLTPEVSAADMKTARTRNENLRNPVVRLRAPANYQATPADLSRLEASDSDVDELIKRAERLMGADDVHGALALLDAAIVKEPDNAKARRARGEVRLDNDDYAGAREDYDHAVDLDPADVEALLGQGRTALFDGRAGDAVISYSVALRLDPANLVGLWGRAASYYLLGRWDRALTDYRALQTNRPDLPAAVSGELKSLIKLNRNAEARAIIDRKLAVTAIDRVALTSLMELTKQEGRPAEALPALDAAAAEAPGDAEILILRGQTRALAGAADGARADFSAVRALAGADPVELNNLCWAQAEVGFDPETALIDCDAAIADAREAGFIDSRALVLLHLGRFDEALAAYEQALAAEPNQTASIYGRGLARLALGDAEGQADLDKARSRSVNVRDSFAVFESRHPELVK